MARVVIAFILCLAAGLLIMRSWQQHRRAAEAQRAAAHASAPASPRAPVPAVGSLEQSSAQANADDEEKIRTAAAVAQRRATAHALIAADRQAAELERFVAVVDEMTSVRERVQGRVEIGLPLDDYADLVAWLSDADVEAEARLARLDAATLQPTVEGAVTSFQQLESALDDAQAGFVNALQQWRTATDAEAEQTALQQRQQTPEWTEEDAARLTALSGQPEAMLQARDASLTSARHATATARRLVGELRERLRQMRSTKSATRPAAESD